MGWFHKIVFIHIARAFLHVRNAFFVFMNSLLEQNKLTNDSLNNEFVS